MEGVPTCWGCGDGNLIFELVNSGTIRIPVCVLINRNCVLIAIEFGPNFRAFGGNERNGSSGIA